MDIQQPPLGGAIDSTEMQRFLQDTYNGIKCPSCWAYLSTARTTSGAWGAVQFDRVLYNNLEPFDTVNYRFLPKVPGFYYYVFNLNLIMYANAAAAGALYLGVVNSRLAGTYGYDSLSHYRVATGTGNGNMFQMSCFGMTYLNGLDDYLQPVTNNGLTAPADITIFDDPRYSYFKAFKITY